VNRSVRNAEVRGSNPFTSTTPFKHLRGIAGGSLPRRAAKFWGRHGATLGVRPRPNNQARLARQVFSAKLKELEYAARIGKLISSGEMSVKWYALGRRFARLLMVA
jgi:hypothetical protein